MLLLFFFFGRSLPRCHFSFSQSPRSPSICICITLSTRLTNSTHYTSSYTDTNRLQCKTLRRNYYSLIKVILCGVFYHYTYVHINYLCFFFSYFRLIVFRGTCVAVACVSIVSIIRVCVVYVCRYATYMCILNPHSRFRKCWNTINTELGTYVEK